MKRSSSNSMIRGEISDSLPLDLILEVFSRLSAKSVTRFRCVSKLWRFMLQGPYFTELFLTRSHARPRLLFAQETSNSEWNFYSVPQLQNPYEKSSLVVAADFHTKFRGDFCNYASGLVYFDNMFISQEKVPMVCNPNTGQYVRLPALISYRKSSSLLGFDPIDKQFKVLAEAYPFCVQRDRHKILTLGTKKLRWRSENHCPRYCHHFWGGVCINGVLYYLAEFSSGYKIVCFDVRSENFKIIHAEFVCDPHETKLINYKGKLGATCWKYGEADVIELHLWDAEKQEWSKYVYTLPKNKVLEPHNMLVAGVTSTGEIVFFKENAPEPFYVFYFNPEGNTFQFVEIRGLMYYGEVYAYVDHVEDLNVYDAKLYSSQVQRSLGQNVKNVIHV